MEVYDTIFSVVESPVQKDLIWAGTDDGLVQLTRDGGQKWENVTPKAMPEWGTVSMIEASAHRTRELPYLAVERHKMDDFAPYIFKTTDFGKTWTKLVNGIPATDYVHAVRVDPESRGFALRRNRARRLCFLRRWRALASAANQPADGAGE